MSIAKPTGFWLSSRYEKGIEESRKPSVIAPVSLMVFNVPVSSSAWLCPAQSAAAKARPNTRARFIRRLLVWMIAVRIGLDAGINRVGIECDFLGRRPLPGGYGETG